MTYTATPNNGGTNPFFQWKVNNQNIGSDSSTFIYNPSNGDTITCELTSDVSCPDGNPAISSTIIMTVSPNLPASVSITVSMNPSCQNALVIFTAHAVNGGPSPIYQWKVGNTNVGTNDSTYTYVPNNGDVVKCLMTSSNPCNAGPPVVSNSIVMIVSPGLPVGVNINASANPVCLGIPVTYTATVTNGGTNPSYQWKVNGTTYGTNTSYSYTPSDGDVITCVVSSTSSCATGNPATSNSITMIVSSNLPVSLIITASANPCCAGQTVTFTASPTNEGTNPFFQWEVNGIDMGPHSPVFSYIPTNNDNVWCILTSSYSCATGSPAYSDTIHMTVNPNLPVSVTITSSKNPSCAGDPVLFTATPVNGGTSPNYQWKVGGHCGFKPEYTHLRSRTR